MLTRFCAYVDTAASTSADTGNQCYRLRPTVVVALTLAALSLVLVLVFSSPTIFAFLQSHLYTFEPSLSNGALFFALCVAVTNPFAVGYAVIVLACGAVFGWWGFPIVYVGSITGASLWFTLFRHCNTHYCGCSIHGLLTVCPQYGLLVRAVTLSLSSHPLKSSSLLQLTFLPFGAVCALLSTTDVSLYHFFLSTCISRLKLLNYIWLSVSASRAKESFYRKDRDYQIQDFLSLIISLTFSLTSLALIAWFANRQLKVLQHSEEQAETQRRLRAILNHDTDTHDTTIAIDEPTSRVRKNSAAQRQLSPTSISDASVSSMTASLAAMVEDTGNDENSSLLRGTSNGYSHVHCHGLNGDDSSAMSLSPSLSATDQQVFAAIASAMSPTNGVRRPRVPLLPVNGLPPSSMSLSLNNSPRHRLPSSSASPSHQSAQRRRPSDATGSSPNHSVSRKSSGARPLAAQRSLVFGFDSQS